ncbi:MAG: hypothetical protein J0I41_23330 [Filimonas sp.]|nr:hypothetical protein [Filimonas sp.]
MFYSLQDTAISLLTWFLIALACVTIVTRKYKPVWKTRIALAALATGMAAILQLIISRLKPGEDFLYASFFGTIFICLLIVVNAYKKSVKNKA